MGSRKSRKTLVAIGAAALLIPPAAALGVPGDFTQPSTSPEAAGSGAISVAAGSFNADANTDLAVANPGTDDVTVMLGNGSGDFAPAGTSPELVGDFPTSVAAANLNGDANLDLVTTDIDGDTATILLGDGAGNFTPAGPAEAAGDDPLAVAAANLDGDGDMDLAVVNNGPGTVTILLNNGSGDFSAAGSSPETVGSNPRFVAAANLDGDADTDLAVANRETDNVSILLNNGSADFTATATPPGAVGDGPNGVIAANLDGDADVDLATANRSSGNVSVLLNDGSAGFTAAATSPEPGGENTRTIAAADFDGNGSTDLAAGNAGAAAVNNVAILLNNGSADFTVGAGSPETVGDDPFSIAAANLDGNAGTDLAVANSESDNVSILLNTSTPDGGPGDPPNAFTFGKVKLNKRKGTAKLPVTVPGPGELALAGGGLKPQRPAARGKAAKPVAGAGTVKLNVKPKGNKKKKLKKTGKVKVKAKVTFTPTGGSANTQTKKIKLKRK